MKLLIFIFSFSISSLSVGSEDIEKVDWDKEYEKLCRYEQGHYCRKIKNYNTWTKPKKEITEALKVMRPRIKETAEELGVDPRVIVGAILTENSINVGIEDSVQNWLVKVGAASDGKIFGKQFSFGWGQLYMSAAKEADKVLAKLENREMLSDDEIAKRLQIPHMAMRYAAALSKHNVDSYIDCACKSSENPKKTCGFDISEKPWIAVTLYNIGKPVSRCRRSIRNNREPRMNFFGLWAGKNEDVINEILGPKDQIIDFEMSKNDGLVGGLIEQEAIEQVSDRINIDQQINYSVFRRKYEDENRLKVIEKLKPSIIPKNIFLNSSSQVDFEKFEQTVRDNQTQVPLKHTTIDDDSFNNLNKQLVQVNQLSNSLDKGLSTIDEFTLNSLPLRCLHSKRDKSKVKKIIVKKEEDIVSILDERTCKNDRYVLLVTSSGKRGWSLKAEVIKKTKVIQDKKQTCSYKYDTKCRERVKYYTGIELTENKELGALTYDISEIQGGDYKSDSCKNFEWNESFQSNLQKSLGIVSYCNIMGKANTKEMQEELLSINQKLQSFSYLDFTDIKDGLSSLYAICRVRSVDNTPKNRGLDRESLKFILCNPGDDPLEANKKIVKFHKEVAILMTYMDSQETEENYFLKELKSFSSKLDGLKNNYKGKKCISMYRDKTREFINKVIGQECIKEIEVPNLDIAADYYENQKFMYIPKDSRKILFRTRKMVCEERK